jgi:hypothetical protein
MPTEYYVHVQRGTAGRRVRILGDIDNLLLEALDFLVRALTCASRKMKLGKLHAQGFVREYQKIRRLRIARLTVRNADRTGSQLLEIEALTFFVWHHDGFG